jgi:hypothetical protein
MADPNDNDVVSSEDDELRRQDREAIEREQYAREQAELDEAYANKPIDDFSGYDDAFELGD